MNTLITNEINLYTNGVENVCSACRNYSHHLPKGDYVRHPCHTLVRPYAVTINAIRLPTEFFGVVGFLFSSEVLL